MNKVAVIDYGMGNLHSVTKAIEYVGRELGEDTEVLVTSNAQDISCLLYTSDAADDLL